MMRFNAAGIHITVRIVAYIYLVNVCMQSNGRGKRQTKLERSASFVFEALARTKAETTRECDTRMVEFHHSIGTTSRKPALLAGSHRQPTAETLSLDVA